MLGTDMVLVYLPDDDLEIPAFLDELESADKSIYVKAPPALEQKKESASLPRIEDNPSQYAILKSQGLQLCFLPQNKPDGSIDYFEVHLVNDTKIDLIYSVHCEVKGRKEEPLHGKLLAASHIRCGTMLLDVLNESPEYLVECWVHTTAGTEGRREKRVRIKAKQFFKKYRTAPLLNKPVYWYVLFDDLGAATSAAKPAGDEDLISYTRRKGAGKKGKKATTGTRAQISLYDPTARAEFESAIDLHIEKLNSNYKRMPKEAILMTQLAAFDHFLEQALRLGVSPVFIIHGLGKGKLREEISLRLAEHPHVKSFKNEYHPLYGHGATEVELGN